MSTCVHGVGGVSVIGTLRDGRAFTCTPIVVKRWGCLLGDVLLADSVLRLIKLLAALVRLLRSCIDLYPFPLDISLDDYLRLWMALKNQSACIMIGFVVFLCWKTTVSDTCLALVFLTLHTWVRWCSSDMYKYQPC